MWPWLTKIFGWVIKLVGGWLPIGTKPLSEWAGKLIWVAGIMVVGLGIYHQITRTTTSTKTNNQQRAAEIVNHYYQPTGGCANVRVWQSMMKSAKKNAGETDQNVVEQK